MVPGGNRLRACSNAHVDLGVGLDEREGPVNIKLQMYLNGLELSKAFLKHNKIPNPNFFTYTEARNLPEAAYAVKLLRRVQDGPLVGTKTGLYTSGYVFVNVPVTAAPVHFPSQRCWSWPGYKVDRTACGVVAHEVGHYLEDCLEAQGRLIPAVHGPEWRSIINNDSRAYRSRKKKVSGYEPVPSEAWAESLRLFILNPDLLQRGIPERYNYILHCGLKPSESRLWYQVIDNNAYFKAAESWINA
jgi:hypothetical protein